MAGRLPSGHICVILPDTHEDGASVVAERVPSTGSVERGFRFVSERVARRRQPIAGCHSSPRRCRSLWKRGRKMGAKDSHDRTLGSPRRDAC